MVTRSTPASLSFKGLGPVVQNPINANTEINN